MMTKPDTASDEIQVQREARDDARERNAKPMPLSEELTNAHVTSSTKRKVLTPANLRVTGGKCIHGVLHYYKRGKLLISTSKSEG